MRTPRAGLAAVPWVLLAAAGCGDGVAVVADAGGATADAASSVADAAPGSTDGARADDAASEAPDAAPARRDAGSEADAGGQVWPGALAIHVPLALDRQTVALGETITGTVTYRNVGDTPVSVQRIVIAGRPPGGTHLGGPWLDFSPAAGPATVQPGATIPWTASRTMLSTDPLGAWISFPTWQDAAGQWHDGPDTPFTVEGPPPIQPGTTMRVVGRHLYDACGQKVVLRGINDMTIWMDPNGNRLAEMAATGANSVRIVWCAGTGTCNGTYGTAAQLDAIIQRALAEGLLPMVELQDATNDFAFVPHSIDYWVQPDIVAVLQRHERTLLVNIANENGGGVNESDYLRIYSDGVQRMRAAGIRAPIVIDAPEWGSDIDFLQRNFRTLQAADGAQPNLLFSLHIYWSWAGTPESRAELVRTELEESVALEMPLVIGEFSGANPDCSAAPPWQAVLTQGQIHGVGWLAWSWGGNSCSGLDMTARNPDGSFAGIKGGWPAEVVSLHAASIANTSIRVPSVAGACP